MTNTRPSLIKLINQLYRFTQSYTDEIFKEYELTSGMYPFLLNLYKKEGMNQNQISKEIGIDKAMSARVIKRLIELGYVTKEADVSDSRAYNLFLTDKAKKILPCIKKGIDGWVDQISEGITGEERDRVIDALSILLDNAKVIRSKKAEREE